MKGHETKQNRRDQNHDAWFGMVHVNTGSLLHQRSAKHYFRGTPEPDIFVPMPSGDFGDDGMNMSLTKRVLKICGYALIGLVVVGIIMWFFLSVTDLDFLKMKPNLGYKIF